MVEHPPRVWPCSRGTTPAKTDCRALPCGATNAGSAGVSVKYRNNSSRLISGNSRSRGNSSLPNTRVAANPSLPKRRPTSSAAEPSANHPGPQPEPRSPPTRHYANLVGLRHYSRDPSSMRQATSGSSCGPRAASTQRVRVQLHSETSVAASSIQRVGPSIPPHRPDFARTGRCSYRARGVTPGTGVTIGMPGRGRTGRCSAAGSGSA